MAKHIKYLENSIAKIMGLMYREKLLLDTESLLALYSSYIHLYLNNTNLTWGNTYQTFHLQSLKFVSVVLLLCPLISKLC